MNTKRLTQGPGTKKNTENKEGYEGRRQEGVREKEVGRSGGELKGQSGWM